MNDLCRIIPPPFPIDPRIGEPSAMPSHVSTVSDLWGLPELPRFARCACRALFFFRGDVACDDGPTKHLFPVGAWRRKGMCPICYEELYSCAGKRKEWGGLIGFLCVCWSVASRPWDWIGLDRIGLRASFFCCW
jgi:hypothetical protein